MHDAHCCIVGGGPAGLILALLLARKNIPVALLEEHGDFDRDFRGDTLHPWTMELMDELGLADRLLQLPHTKIRQVAVQTAEGPVTLADFSRLKTKFPYITFMPQALFLDFIAREAAQYPGFRLEMGASAQALLTENGAVRGVRYRSRDGRHELSAPLTVGADGRFSRIRRLAGLELIKTSPPMDVLWFRLPRQPDDAEGLFGRLGGGRILILLERGEQWQAAYVIPKGAYRALRDAGLEALRRSVTEVAPELADRVQHLDSWSEVSLLSVESSRLARWYRPGLLLIGDAAHVMSPVGGVGINYAIQDAVVAANVLGRPLLSGRLRVRDLSEVQRRREWPTRIVQALQSVIQQRVLAPALDPTRPFRLPAFMRMCLPILRDVPARVIGHGFWPPRLDE